jgi:hypothetical protein
MNRKANFYITAENYRHLCGSGLWDIQDLPSERAEQVQPFLNNGDTIAVFASGLAPRAFSQSGPGPVAGIDWVRLERNPQPSEPDLNVYHYAVLRPDEHGYPVMGPYMHGTIAPHWAELPDLDRYRSSPPTVVRNPYWRLGFEGSNPFRSGYLARRAWVPF